MFSFFMKKPSEDTEEAFRERVKRIDIRLTRLEADILDLATAQNIMRNKVLRKIQFKKEEEEEENPKNPYSHVLLPEK